MAYVIQSFISWLPENLIISMKGHVTKYLVFHHHVAQKVTLVMAEFCDPTWACDSDRPKCVCVKTFVDRV